MTMRISLLPLVLAITASNTNQHCSASLQDLCNVSSRVMNRQVEHEQYDMLIISSNIRLLNYIAKHYISTFTSIMSNVSCWLVYF